MKGKAMKKIVICLCTLCSLVCLAFAMSSCGHEHTPMTTVVEKTAATCTERGVDEVIVKCVDCQAEISRTTTLAEKLAHTPSDWIIDVPSTCVTKGTKHKECTVCREVLESTDAELSEDHVEVIDEAVEPTETENGWTAGSHCELCGVAIIEREVIPAGIVDAGIMSSSGVLTVDIEAETLTGEIHTPTFSFLKDIVVAKGASYIVSDEISCNNPILSKTVEFDGSGEYRYYIFVTNKNVQVLYTVYITHILKEDCDCEFCNPTEELPEEELEGEGGANAGEGTGEGAGESTEQA
jgi:hypothetical protein